MKNIKYYASARKDLDEFIPKGLTRTLDLGCGSGEFSKKLQDMFGVPETWGIEGNPDAAKIAKESIENLLCGDVNLLVEQLPNSYFDCIFCNDILEHLTDPWGLLNMLKEKLASDGIIIASIPNILHYKVLYGLIFKKDFKYIEAGVLDSTHLRFFTKKSIFRMFNETGYEVVQHKAINVTRKWKVKIFGFVTFGFLNDIRATQFLFVVRKKHDEAIV